MPKKRPEEADWVHGTRHCYRYMGCRCEECIVGSRDELRSQRQARAEVLVGTPGDHHGKTSTYSLGCRCEDCKAAISAYHKSYTYGLNAEEYQSLSDSQEGKCAICMQTPKDALHIDHDHDTGAVRGLLCRGCNMAIGKLGDDAETVQRAADYLRRSELL